MCLYLSSMDDDAPAALPEVADSVAPFAVTRLALLGIRGPVRPCDGALRGLADADDMTFALLTPSGSPTTDLDRAEMLAALINAGLGLAPAPRAGRA